MLADGLARSDAVGAPFVLLIRRGRSV